MDTRTAEVVVHTIRTLRQCGFGLRRSRHPTRQDAEQGACQAAPEIRHAAQALPRDKALGQVLCEQRAVTGLPWALPEDAPGAGQPGVWRVIDFACTLLAPTAAAPAAPRAAGWWRWQTRRVFWWP